MSDARRVVIISYFLLCFTPFCLPSRAQQPPPAPKPEVIVILREARAAQEAFQWQKALPLYAQAAEKARMLEDRAGEAVALMNSGVIYADFGDPHQAPDYYERALRLMKALGDRRSQAIILENLGSACLQIGQTQKGMESFEQALLLSRETGDKEEEARVLINIGRAYTATDRYQKAMETYARALPLVEASNNKRTQANLFNNLGEMYYEMGQAGKALEYYNKALPLLKEIRFKVGEAILYINIGAAYLGLEQTTKALESYQQALPLVEELGYKSGEALACNNIGLIYDTLGQAGKAQAFYEKALAIEEALGYRRGEATTLCNLGAVYAALDRPEKALETLEKARTRAQSVSALNVITLCYAHSGEILQKQGRKEEAIAAYRLAVEALESMRGSVQSEEDRQALLEGSGKVNVYEDLVRLLSERGRPEDLQEALTLLDRARSKQLLDSLRLDSLTVRDPKLRDLLARTQALETAVGAQERLRLEELNKPKEQQNPDRLAGLARLVAGTKAEMRAVTNTIAINFPNDFARFVAVKPVDLKALQAHLPPGALVVEYSPLETALVVFLVTRDTIHTFTLPVSRQRLEQQVEAFRKEMERAGATRSKPGNGPAAEERRDLAHWNWDQPGARPLRELITTLYGELVSRLSGEFASADQIVIIPNGLLCYLPFPALARELPDHHLRFFAEEKRLSVLPQLRLWNEIVEKEAMRKPGRGRLALFGDPDGSLPGAQAEAKRIGGLFANSLLFLGADATKAHLTSLPEDIGMAHLATHGVLDSRDVNGSYLLLAGGQKLKLSDLYGLTFPFRMIVLSACDTALGYQNSGSEQTTLADGFVDAGSTTLIASLWPVSDASTAALMERFYQELRAGKSVSEALQTAEVSLLRNPATAHPYFWSPFTLMGDWR